VTARACWFCGTADLGADDLRISLGRDKEEYLLGLYEEWKATWVVVPRCRRCWISHRVERGAGYVVIGSAAFLGLLLIAWGASRLSGDSWADEWQLLLPVTWMAGCLLLWRGVRQRRFAWRWLAPRPERYGREHPAVVQLVDDGWEIRGTE
jgi:hypothetical protein